MASAQSKENKREIKEKKRKRNKIQKSGREMMNKEEIGKMGNRT